MPCGTPLNTLQAVVPRSPLGPAENIALFEYSGPDDCLSGFLNGKFERGGIEQFYRNVDTAGAGENFKTRGHKRSWGQGFALSVLYGRVTRPA